VHILNLHHVFEDEESGFRQLIEHLRQTHRVISYSEAISRIWTGAFDAPYLAFTFDDGIKSCLLAARILQEFGVSACFFVCSGACELMRPDQHADFAVRNVGMPPVEFLNWSDLEELVKRGHEIGSHSATHANLDEIAPEQAHDEICRSLASLSARLGPIRHFSVPYGKFHHFNPQIVETVFDAGYESCATGERGCHVFAAPNKRSLCVRREHLMANWPLSHVDYFLAHSARTASAQKNTWSKILISR
jgi:peptidoglycan/xylan/chitin deacetylase (PgdA/CDA1 family)